MIKRSLIFPLVVASTACSATDITNINANNMLGKCIEITPVDVEQYKNTLLLNTKWRIHNTIGECGCKSAAFNYDVYIKESSLHIAHGVVSSIGKDGFTFVINADSSIYKNASYILETSCLNPQ